MHELAALTGQMVGREAPDGFMDAVSWAEKMKSKIGENASVN